MARVGRATTRVAPTGGLRESGALRVSWEWLEACSDMDGISESSAYDAWAEVYDSVYSYVRADTPFYMGEALESGGPVLELGVGTGRVAIPTARLGLQVVGLDSSEAMPGGGAAQAGGAGSSWRRLAGTGVRGYAGLRPAGRGRKTADFSAGHDSVQGVPGAVERGRPGAGAGQHTRSTWSRADG